MIKFEIIYVDLETAEVIQIRKDQKKQYEIKELSRHWKYTLKERKLTIIYSIKKSRQLNLWNE